MSGTLSYIARDPADVTNQIMEVPTVLKEATILGIESTRKTGPSQCQ
jgi:hypothetical protein